MPELEEVIIIGSGFAGGSAAMALADRGFRVTIVERGPWRTTRTGMDFAGREAVKFPRGRHLFARGLRSVGGIWPSRQQSLLLNRFGLFDYFVGDGLDVISSSSVGGNSHVYGGISVRPKGAGFWDSAGQGLSSAAMAEHYDAVERLMQVRTIDQSALGTAALTRRYANVAGLRLDDASLGLPLAVSANPNSAVARGEGGLLGCEDSSKFTVDTVFLAPYLKDGRIKVLDLHEAVMLQREGDNWRVRVCDRRQRSEHDLVTRRLVLAAGAFSSVALLLRSREAGLGLSDGIGKGFGGNGDVAGLWFHPKGTNLSKSYPTLQRIAFAEDAEALDMVEASLLLPEFLPLPKFLGRKLQHISMIAGMGCDAMDGRIYVSGNRLRLSYNPENSPVLSQFKDAFGRVAALTDTKITELKRLFTVHPTGGAAIGQVVDATGQMFGASGLYIADASAFPRPLGCAPSLTIAAWARHVAYNIH